jgi:hypothetical protein
MLVLALVTVVLAGLVVGRVSAQADDSPTDHPPIVVPTSTVTPSPSPTPSADHDDDDDGDDFTRITPRPRDIDDDDDDDHSGRDHPEDD